MIKLQIIEKDKYLYTLKDSTGKMYKLNLEFYGIDINTKDIINISEKLLDPKDENYCSMYTFGNLDSKYGKANININDIDVIILEKDDKNIYLKRLYG